MRVVTIAFCLAGVGSLFGAATTVQFNRDVRPILSDKCFHCHGADAKAKNVPMRLDREDEARRAIASGELVRRVTAEKPAQRMPPAYSGLTLTAREIETLRAWIDQGAQWEAHWSFIPPKRHPLPPVKNAAWSKNAIDAFVLDRLQREGLSPSPETAKETLIRRVTVDLTGVSPTPAEVDAFLADKSPKAYEKVVDRLLASQRYGERMAARWLDAARYADTNGYQYDGERYMWRWRDWVIESFNRNQPFDQFTLEQMAGDMLPNATLDQKIATGFNRNHRGNTEDGIVAEEYAVEYVVDRVETVSTVFLGLTLGCARCHNHKYDPFTQKEFYQVFAYLNNVPENGRAMKYGNSPPLVAAPTRDQQAKLNDFDLRMDALQGFLKQHEAAIARAQAAWKQDLKGTEFWAPTAALDTALTFEQDGEAKSEGGAVQFAPGRVGRAASFDGSADLNAGNKVGVDIEDPFTMSAWVNPSGQVDGPIVTKMRDGPKGRGFGLHLDKGKVHFHLTSVYESDALRLDTEETIAPNRWTHLLVTYTGSRMAEGVRIYIDGKQAKTRTDVETLYRPLRNARKPFPEPLRVGGGWGPERRFRGLIDDVRIYTRTLRKEEITALAVGRPLKNLTEQAQTERDQLRWAFLESAASAEARDAWKQLTALRLEKEAFERTLSTVMVMAESPVQKDTFQLIRGEYNKHGEKVEPGLPAALPRLPDGAPNNRLGFAKWLIHPSNPLLARVTVNRFWQMYFGTGIVKTVEDFGQQGEWPSHPELLDWLATEFIRTGWDVKAMQKLIVTSAAYRQSSKVTPELLQRDPENRLMARGPRLRIPAEVVRDQALFAAGLLVEKIGGPSVKPYQPEGLWKEIGMQDIDYAQDHGADLYRRSLYTYWRRSAAPPMMANFDSAMRESCVVRESRTNTPLQALNLMNDVTMLEAARFIGQRMMKEGGADVSSRLRYGFRLIAARMPTQGEEAVLRDSFQFHLDYFSGKPDRVKSFLSLGESKPDPSLDRRELAAFGSVASLILNLDEAVTKE